MGNSISQQLQLVDLENNQISSVTLGSGYSNTLILIGNPVCTSGLSNMNYCQLQVAAKAYSTSLASCGSKVCPADQKLSPQSCNCAYPYEGTMTFRAPSFRELSNANNFHSLELNLWMKLSLTPGSVSLQDLYFDNDDYLQLRLELFPATEKYFNRSEVQRLGFYLSGQTFKPPEEFGPYFFIAFPYPFPGTHNGTSISLGVIIAIAIGCTILILGLVGVGIYDIRQKRRAERAIGLSKPFASWAPSGKDSGGAPQLKGARWFSYDKLKKCTKNFSESNEIGSSYRKVYRGMLPNGQVVAIKRAQQGSMQGGLEFKTEIELLSRVHHKNVVGLVSFCFEQGEQRLVYEFMPNGTLRESLSGRSGIPLDWKRRLRLALGSARGLAYLHKLADPPIIHRDVKSTNILLDENLIAKVADFGLSKLVSDSKGHVSTQVKGTLDLVLAWFKSCQISDELVHAKFQTLVYPRMIAIHNLMSKEGDGSLLPPDIPLSSEHVNENGIYLLENGEDALIYIGNLVESEILRQLFDTSSVEDIPTQVLLRMLPNYFHHVRSYDNTLITKFFGLHRIKPSSGQKKMISPTIHKDLFWFLVELMTIVSSWVLTSGETDCGGHHPPLVTRKWTSFFLVQQVWTGKAIIYCQRPLSHACRSLTSA